MWNREEINERIGKLCREHIGMCFLALIGLGIFVLYLSTFFDNRYDIYTLLVALGAAFIVTAFAMLILSYSGRAIEETVVRQIDRLRDNIISELKSEEKERMTFSQNQSDANTILVQYIRTHKPSEARLIEYSAWTIQDIIDNLKQIKCNIKLLIAHPDIATSELQKERIHTRIRNLIEIDFRDYNNVEIRCYKDYQMDGKKYTAFASIRGRTFDDDFINIGWFTPTRKLEGGIIGHRNPMVSGYVTTKSGIILKKMFDEIFDLLWENAIPAKDVYDEYYSSEVRILP